jgi:hypothetical protein
MYQVQYSIYFCWVQQTSTSSSFFPSSHIEKRFDLVRNDSRDIISEAIQL